MEKRINLTRKSTISFALAADGGWKVAKFLRRVRVAFSGRMRPHPIERISRDLSTYLRQPWPDRALTLAAAWMLTQDKNHDLWT